MNPNINDDVNANIANNENMFNNQNEDEIYPDNYINQDYQGETIDYDNMSNEENN